MSGMYKVNEVGVGPIQEFLFSIYTPLDARNKAISFLEAKIKGSKKAKGFELQFVDGITKYNDFVIYRALLEKGKEDNFIYKEQVDSKYYNRLLKEFKAYADNQWEFGEIDNQIYTDSGELLGKILRLEVNI